MTDMLTTKAQVLAAVEDLTDDVQINPRWSVKVRALTDAEFNRAQSKLMRGQQVTTTREEMEDGIAGEKVNLSIEGLVEGEFTSRVFICSTGILGTGDLKETWSEGEVRKIPFPGAVQKISDRILELGGHSLFEGLDRRVRRQVSTFRNDSGGTGDSGVAADGDSAGEESDGDDHSSKGLSEGSGEQGIAEASA